MTEFSELYPSIRAFLGDTDVVGGFSYSNDTINQNIRFVIATIKDKNVKEDGNTAKFVSVLDSRQKALVTALSVRNTQSFTPDEFSYKTPVVSVKRKGNHQLLGWLDNMIRKLSGEKILASDTEIDAIVSFNSKFFDELFSAYEKA